MSWCVIESGGQLYGIPVEDVLEVVRGAETEPVPGAPSGVVGLLNLRGQLVVALGVRDLVEGTAWESPERVVAVVTSYKGENVALCVDSVYDVRDVKEEQLADIPGGSGGLEKIGRRVMIDDERIIIEIDIESLISRVGRTS